MSILSKNLQYLMMVKNINKNQLAKILGIPSMSIGRWVNGKITDPQLSKLCSLSDFFEVSIDDIVFQNLEIKDSLQKLYNEDYISIPTFEWNGGLILDGTKTIRSTLIARALNIGSLDELFSVVHPSEYFGIYPKKAVLVFSKIIIKMEMDEIFLVLDGMANTLRLVQYCDRGFICLLTHKKLDIEQYSIKGVLVNIVLDRVFMDISI